MEKSIVFIQYNGGKNPPTNEEYSQIVTILTLIKMINNMNMGVLRSNLYKSVIFSEIIHDL